MNQKDYDSRDESKDFLLANKIFKPHDILKVFSTL